MLFSGKVDDPPETAGDDGRRWRPPKPPATGEVDALLAHFARRRRRDSVRRWLLWVLILVNVIIAAGLIMGYLPFFCLT